jgi:hypothetical protein
MGAALFRRNEAKMADLREMVRAGWSQKRIAAVLNVHQGTISDTVNALRIPHRRNGARAHDRSRRPSDRS